MRQLQPRSRVLRSTIRQGDPHIDLEPVGQLDAILHDVIKEVHHKGEFSVAVLTH